MSGVSVVSDKNESPFGIELKIHKLPKQSAKRFFVKRAEIGKLFLENHISENWQGAVEKGRELLNHGHTNPTELLNDVSTFAIAKKHTLAERAELTDSSSLIHENHEIDEFRKLFAYVKKSIKGTSPDSLAYSNFLEAIAKIEYLEGNFEVAIPLLHKAFLSIDRYSNLLEYFDISKTYMNALLEFKEKNKSEYAESHDNNIYKISEIADEVIETLEGIRIRDHKPEDIAELSELAEFFENMGADRASQIVTSEIIIILYKQKDLDHKEIAIQHRIFGKKIVSARPDTAINQLSSSFEKLLSIDSDEAKKSFKELFEAYVVLEKYSEALIFFEENSDYFEWTLEEKLKNTHSLAVSNYHQGNFELAALQARKILETLEDTDVQKIKEFSVDIIIQAIEIYICSLPKIFDALLATREEPTLDDIIDLLDEPVCFDAWVEKLITYYSSWVELDRLEKLIEAHLIISEYYSMKFECAKLQINSQNEDLSEYIDKVFLHMDKCLEIVREYYSDIDDSLIIYVYYKRGEIGYLNSQFLLDKSAIDLSISAEEERAIFFEKSFKLSLECSDDKWALTSGLEYANCLYGFDKIKEAAQVLNRLYTLIDLDSIGLDMSFKIIEVLELFLKVSKTIDERFLDIEVPSVDEIEDKIKEIQRRESEKI